MLIARSGTSAVAALVAATALAAPAAGSQGGFVLGARGVEALARRAARAWGDSHPRMIEYATGSLEAAMPVIASGTTGPLAGDARSEVDLVLIEGRFTANVSTPHGARPPTGSRLELLVDAHSGAVEMRALWQHGPPVPLSRLGQVRVLHGAGGGPHRRRRR